MTATLDDRDYRLTGPANRRAVERGLADGSWWRPPIAEARLTELMQRTNGRAIRDTAVWLGLIIGLGLLAVLTWPSWWSIPILFAYGALYGGAADSRWHEFGHGTASKLPALNTAVYYLASFMLWREPTLWRWSHYRHHTDTIIVGRDAEIVFPRPSSLAALPLTYLHWINGPKMLNRMARHAITGRPDPEAADFIPESEHRRLVWEARAFIAILAGTVVLAVVLWNPLLVLLVGLPTIYGAWLVVFFGITQHAGLREDVLDHRLNTRTVHMNPVFRFLYSNMNYHIEHHIFPGVPYYNLPALHEEIKQYLPAANPSTIAAYRELLNAMRHQESDPDWEIPDRFVPDVPSAGVRPIDVGPIVPHAVEGRHRLDLGAVGDVPVGQARRVDRGDRTFAIYRLAADDVVVSDGLCTHGQAHLAEGLIIDCTIECPKHNGRFDLRTGEPARQPVKQPLRLYACEVVGGRVLVDFPDDPPTEKSSV